MTLPEGSNGRKTGAIFVEEGLISSKDVEKVLAIQEKNRMAENRNRLFGMVLCDLSLITPTDNYCALDKHGILMSVEDYLVSSGIVTSARLDQLSARARAKDIPLISFLLDKGVVAKSMLQQALFDLFHIPFRSVSDIVFEKESRDVLAHVIGRDAADVHRCIPLQLSGPSLLVGITDPANLVFLRDLDHTFPQYRFTPVFIPFSGFTWFYRMLYESSWEGGKKPVDLSLLMKSSVVVSDPVRDEKKIFAFFDRYERVGQAGKKQSPREGGRRELFLEFFRRHHGRIADMYDCSRIRFSLNMAEGRLQIQAEPEKEGEI